MITVVESGNIDVTGLIQIGSLAGNVIGCHARIMVMTMMVVVKVAATVSTNQTMEMVGFVHCCTSDVTVLDRGRLLGWSRCFQRYLLTGA